MKYLIALLGAISFGQIGIAKSEALYRGMDAEYCVIPEEDPILSASFEIERYTIEDNEVTVRGNVIVNSSCVQVKYEIRHEGDKRHYIDYYLEDDGSNCGLGSKERVAAITLSDLVPGKHTISIMGPDGHELKFKLDIQARLQSYSTL